MNKITTVDLLRELNSETKLVILYFLLRAKNKYHNLCVGDIAEITKRNIKNISKQLLELKNANILICSKSDREVFYN
jgi:DNA-binding transcriptional ArsR family regulator